ncbi:hypothetical protein [Sphingomonas leidyi]|uniref:hypothetical protein n=1 Tax=Sphingomonas leidyi TaxID=68569 RepID=UPI0036D3AA13
MDSLVVNPANDRHGELENETAAIARLFALRETHMRNLTKDLVAKGEIFEPPLVYPEGDKFIIADGNRRTTCLKLLASPKRAPTVELQQFFAEQKKAWNGKLPDRIQCQVETDRDRVDDILFRRHTGSQNGVGQSTWDDRMKNNFVVRTGKGTGTNVADEIEKRLAAAGLLPKKKIPRSNMNRLLSAEAIRNRLGFSIRKGKFEYLRNEDSVRNALHRVADDLSSGKLTLNDIWDTEKKLAYVDGLDHEGVLPTVADAPKKPASPPATPAPPKPTPAPKPTARINLIPHIEYGVVWVGRLQRHHAIWEELQFKLELSEHPNAISVLFRVLLELSVDNYIAQTNLTTVNDGDKLAKKILKAAEDLHAQGKITAKYRDVFRKAQNMDALISTDTLNRYVHSPQFAPSPEHLKAMWDTLGEFVVLCLNA